MAGMTRRFFAAMSTNGPTGSAIACSWRVSLLAFGYVVAASIATPAVVFAQTGTSAPATKPDPNAPPSTSTPKPAVPAPPSGIEEIVVQGSESEAANDFENADSVTG